MAIAALQSLALWGLFMITVADAVVPRNFSIPSVRAELGNSFQLQCNVSSGEDVTWEMRNYNSSTWETLDSKEPLYRWEKVNEKDLGIYRCQNKVTGKVSCSVGLRVYKSHRKFFNIRESQKNIILMVEGILLLSLVVIPGTILLREKSQRTLKEKIQRYKEENENLYEGLNQAELTTYEDITRGQQSMYQDVANYRLSDSQLEQP
ncbi:B-cell antigen receptor complex-associated protein alpha chain [Stegostoma tigrinum]|uniref:B-cell antigen receptor complex-associated protein alpha chain n=1 Tax=Stegostoma tigrinum TaxID=3053191 RepID=UPI0028702DBF|nr:B-cell antigen receptor complex-associated protein alpha chain [Stegostoma tigrinum]